MDKKSMTKRPLALGNKFFPVFHADCVCLFVCPLKVSLVDAKDVQLRRRRKNCFYFV